MVHPSLISKICDNLEFMNFIIGSSMIHYGQLVLSVNLENVLVNKINDVKTDLDTIKDTEQFVSDHDFHDYISDIELFINKTEKAISMLRDQRFIEANCNC